MIAGSFTKPRTFPAFRLSQMRDAAGIAKYCRRPIEVRQLTLTIIDWLARALPCAGTSLAQVCSIESRELLANAERPHDATFQRLQGSPP